jgi:signal transduction histidine kinase
MSHYLPRSMSLPLLPLLLWDTPPGLELALAQEGVAFRKLRHFHPLAFQGGRFVLYDSRRVAVHVGVRGRMAEIRVTDNGPGVSLTMRSHLFEPFQTEKPNGVGIGLALARKIALAHRGDLVLEDEPQGARKTPLPDVPAPPFTGRPGATFLLTLPLES